MPESENQPALATQDSRPLSVAKPSVQTVTTGERMGAAVGWAGRGGGVRERREKRGHLPRVMPDAINARACIKDGGRAGEDTDAAVSPGHGGPDADGSAKGLETWVVGLRGPVTILQGNQNRGSPAP